MCRVMSCSLSELPIELMESTFRLLNYHTLFSLRKVSKVTKCVAELTILNQYRNPVIDCVDFSGESENKIKICFKFDQFNKQSRFLAKLCIVSAITYLRITGFVYQPKVFASFFTQLTSLMSEATVNSLQFNHASLNIFSHLSMFFEQKTVPRLTFKLTNSEEAKRLCAANCQTTSIYGYPINPRHFNFSHW
ncbi:hypothetical protein PRIPAC_87096, partial [Pristionchus pacificus]